jgi:hypothetical protein
MHPNHDSHTPEPSFISLLLTQSTAIHITRNHISVYKTIKRNHTSVTYRKAGENDAVKQLGESIAKKIT